jgi:hypothetical protein
MKWSRLKEGVMSFRILATLVVLWSLSLVVAVTIAMAQAVPPMAPIIVSGNDVGFRIEGQRGLMPVGKIVVRIEGQWVDAALSQLGTPLIAVPLTEQPDISPRLPGGRRP